MTQSLSEDIQKAAMATAKGYQRKANRAMADDTGKMVDIKTALQRLALMVALSTDAELCKIFAGHLAKQRD